MKENRLSGIADLEWTSMTHTLTRLDLSNNRIQGSLPDLSAAGGLKTVQLSNNRMSGKINQSFGVLHAAELIDLRGNDGLELKDEQREWIQEQLGRSVAVLV